MLDEVQMIQDFQADPNEEKFGKLYDNFAPLITSAIKSNVGPNNPLPKGAVYGEALQIFDKAMRTYDPSKGAKITTYLYDQFQRMKRYVRDNRDIAHIPETRSIHIWKMKDSEDMLTSELGRTPSTIELSDHVGLPPKMIKTLRKEMKKDLVAEQGMETFTNDDRTDELEDYLKGLYMDVPPVQQNILEHTFGWYGKKKLKPAQMAKKLGTTEQTIYYERGKLKKKFDKYYAKRID